MTRTQNPIQTSLSTAQNHAFDGLDLGGVCFISDLHLSENLPSTCAQFTHFCQTIAPQFDTLIILGDLFAYWLGDDTTDQNPTALLVIDTLQALRSQGVQIGFVAGNRDFLVHQSFCERAGMVLLPDPCIVQIQQQRVLLTHGDLLCTDDARYQRYRRLVHKPWAQKIFLSTPRSWRSRLANRLRRQSKLRWDALNPTQRAQLSQLQDVNPATAQCWFSEYQTGLMIHGHTHLPSTHLTHATKRMVLPDWDCEQPAATRWGYIAWHVHGAQPELIYALSVAL